MLVSSDPSDLGLRYVGEVGLHQLLPVYVVVGVDDLASGVPLEPLHVLPWHPRPQQVGGEPVPERVGSKPTPGVPRHSLVKAVPLSSLPPRPPRRAPSCYRHDPRGLVVEVHDSQGAFRNRLMSTMEPCRDALPAVRSPLPITARFSADLPQRALRRVEPPGASAAGARPQASFPGAELEGCWCL